MATNTPPVPVAREIQREACLKKLVAAFGVSASELRIQDVIRDAKALKEVDFEDCLKRFSQKTQMAIIELGVKFPGAASILSFDDMLSLGLLVLGIVNAEASSLYYNSLDESVEFFLLAHNLT